MEILLLSFPSFLFLITIRLCSNGALVNWTGLKCKKMYIIRLKSSNCLDIYEDLIQQKITRLTLKITRSSEKSLGMSPLVDTIPVYAFCKGI